SAVTPAGMLNTRLASLPLTAIWLAPGPVMVRALVMSNSPLVKAMVPCMPGAKTIWLAPGLPLASRTAWRREPSPLSARLLTTKVRGRVRSSRARRRGTNDHRRAGRHAGFRPEAPRSHENKERAMRRNLRLRSGLRQEKEAVARARRPNVRAGVGL